MSKFILSSAIKGAHKIVEKAEEQLNRAIKEKGEDFPIKPPDTAYFVPIIYSILGHKVEKLGDFKPVLEEAKKLLPPPPSEKLWLPYLGPALDAGMATLFAEEIIEFTKPAVGISWTEGIWLGPPDDVILRERGVEFTDGRAPGFAVVVGAAPDNETAVKLARELQATNLYIFFSGHTNGVSMAEQLAEEGIELGWETRLVPFGKDIYSAIYAVGFAARAAMAFGGIKPGDYRRILLYVKNRIFAFVLALGFIDEEKYATAAGAINWGAPVITDQDIPPIYPTGVTLYEHVVPKISYDEMVSKALETRGLKVEVTKVDIPVPYGPAFEGERVRKENLFLEMGGTKTPSFELLVSVEPDEVEDGKIEVIGPDIDSLPPEGGKLPFGFLVKVAGGKMRKEFESVLERQIHRFFNHAQGVMHIGQRDINWVRISKDAAKAGFKLKHLGEVVRASLLSEYGRVVDKVEVQIYTDESKVNELREKAREIFHERDERLKALTDDAVDVFYSCTLCQSFAPAHVCVVSPERIGLCGAYTWLDTRAHFEIEPTGPNQPIEKGALIDPEKGMWEGINKFVRENSHGKIERVSLYSMMHDPMTCCGCFEVILAILPTANGIMAVQRGYTGMTPVGMTFSTLAGMVGGGQQTPGFMGVGKAYLGSKKFISADGGLLRLVWMPKELKEELKPVLEKRAKELGVPDLVEKIADETVAQSEEEVLEFMQKVEHPALGLPALL
jgi:acetyl-CoA synthase